MTTNWTLEQDDQVIDPLFGPGTSREPLLVTFDPGSPWKLHRSRTKILLIVDLADGGEVTDAIAEQVFADVHTHTYAQAHKHAHTYV
ncbi:hypothetical protein EVAR_74250_1 [Eumeta japonica]|uniref:Uncharacterized protein n=1 Tax=Eumeta variegata TaxID=151549 RepID=A0A4C1SCR9_EUMVA|nr:hypothetical protein EVAR_74250_1 [Eumeta japonica]